MSIQKQTRLFVIAVLASLAIATASESAAYAQAIEPMADCTAHSLTRNDDEYSDPIGIGFDIRLGSSFYSQLRISNNGYVSFGPRALLWWQLQDWELYDVPLIAAFHADVDTRPLGATPVSWGYTTFEGHAALCINWFDVGHYDMHDEVLNTFQLLLVKSDSKPGDFEVVMNYDKIEWDDPADPGGIPPRVGIYDGSVVRYEVSGSNQFSTLLDGGTNALTTNSEGTLLKGRYRRSFTDGIPPNTAVVTGLVTDGNGSPVAGAPVEVCETCPDLTTYCEGGTTDSTGHYSISNIDSTKVVSCPEWTVRAMAPDGSDLLEQTIAVTLTPTDPIASGADVQLLAPEYVPSGTTITPASGGVGTVPTVYWQAPLTLTTAGCAGGAARYMITSDGSDDLSRCDTGTPGSDAGLVRCGEMAETPVGSGAYVANLAPLYPAHGTVKITMGLTCPDASFGQSSFDMYIDPSGWVLTLGGVPLSGAQVTLYRAESPFGPFRMVPSGSALMSPKNRTNPDHTDAAGHFGWDTVAGYYVVRAEYPGCVAPDNPVQPYVETEVLAVPPEWTDLHLYLDCGGIEPPRLSLPTQVVAEAASTAGAVVTYAASAIDDHDGPVPVTCAPASGGQFAAGTTTVSCAASNYVGNVASGSFPVIVSYRWSNVLPPLQATGLNRLKLGRTVPVKFSLAGASAGVRDLTARLYVAAVIGGVPGPELPATTTGSVGNVFEYGGHKYKLEWSTSCLTAGLYQLRIDLGDGVPHTVQVELR